MPNFTKGYLKNDVFFQFLSRLYVSLDDVRDRILGIRPLLSLREVFSEVHREESRREESRHSLMLPLPVERSFLNTHSSGDTHVKKGHPWCDHCRTPGHVHDKCWKLHGRPANWTPSKSSSRPSHGNFVVTTLKGGSFSRQHLDDLRQMFGHLQIPPATESKYLCTVSEGSSPFTFLSPSPGCVSWIIDSGASDHMTGNFSLFSTFHKNDISCSVRTADGSLSPVKGSGSIRINSHITLSNVLFVPSLTCNLLSISKLSTDLGCTSHFTRDYCEFQDLTSGMVIGNARRCGGLYIIDAPPYTLIPNHSPAPFISSFVSVSPTDAAADIVLYKGNSDQSKLDVVIETSELPIAQRKGVRRCTTHHISKFAAYGKLMSGFKTFIAKVDHIHILETIEETLKSHGWKKAVEEEISAVENNKTLGHC
ncbi:uncharacterized protein LOC120122339 [Hibiscus syriacus]|uniref:uncharacterized protein LOC120122339 n=1 Tax=Hibiscus syriacus TaxID=106335 RepID=UPI0019214C01|nr:uncharacterized protein LOC120122339 [Hibiscus syriacus]